MVHYQSRAQVPAPCVGKARRPPVLQVSAIQTPREGGGPQGRGQERGVSPPLPLTRFRSFSSAARAASLRCKSRTQGGGRESSGGGGGVQGVP